MIGLANFMKRIRNYLNIKILFVTILFVSALIFSARANAATIYAGSASETVSAGQTFVVDWYMDSNNQPVNVINVGFTFSTSTIKLVDISTAGSGVSLWVKNPIESLSGTITALGGVPAGVMSNHVSLFRTTFLAVESGAATFSLVPGSQTLRSDGFGTSDNLKFTPITFSVLDKLKQETVSSPTHPDQQSWYSRNDTTIVFPVEKDMEYSYSFSANPEITPPTSPTSTIGIVTYKNLPDGLYYFKLANRLPGAIWREIGVYRVQIDKTGPEKFTPIISSDSGMFDGQKFLSFNTTDKISGIKEYQIKSGLIDFYHTTKTPQEISRPLIGDGVVVRAIDNAGNNTDEFVAYPGYINTKVSMLLLLGLLILLVVYKLLRAKVYNK